MNTGSAIPRLRARAVTADPDGAARGTVHELPAGMTRTAWEAAARQIWEDAYRIDPVFTLEITRAVTGGEVFAWSAITTAQVRALHRGLFPTARLSVFS